MSARFRSPADVPPGHEITPEELLAMPEGKHFELIDGQARERPSHMLVSLTVTEWMFHVGNACDREKMGWVLAGMLGYRCFPWNPNLVRRSNLSVILAERVTPERMSESYCTIPPDLVVDMIYPGDLADYHARKLDDYMRAGVRLIWIANPRLRIVQVWRGDGTGQRLRASDVLSGEDVIPGFRCRVGDLFPSPPRAENEAFGKPEATHEVPES